MKRNLIICVLLVGLFSCKKEIVSNRNQDYLRTVKNGLKDSLALSDYNALDFEKAVLSKVDSASLHYVRIPFKKGSISTEFVIVKTDADGKIEQGKIVHLEGKISDDGTGSPKRKQWDGRISLSSLNRKNTFESAIVDGFVLAYHGGVAYRAQTQVVEGLMPEIIITYVISSGNDFSWSSWMNLQSFFYVGPGSDVGNYYGSMDGGPSGSGSGGVSLGSGSGNPPSGDSGPSIENPILIDMETMDENPAIDIQRFINCFNAIPDDGATCSIEIMTDIPVDNNPSLVYDIDARSPGHTFLSISKSNGTQHVTQNIGFYPSSGYKSITYAPVASKMVDNGGHEFNASLRMSVTPERLKTALQAVLLYKDHNYDVDEYNCTDFALDVFNSVRGIGLSVPKYGIPGSPLTQATHTPGGLYNKLKEMVSNNDPEKRNITIGIYKGYAGNSHGPCN